MMMMMMNENRIGTYPSKVDCTKSVMNVHEEENNPGLVKKKKRKENESISLCATSFAAFWS